MTSQPSCTSPPRVWSANPSSIPQKYYANNLAGTLSLLEAMREAGCNRLVFRQRRGIWQCRQQGAAEDYACAPINSYGASKWMIERVLADYRTAYGLGSFALRYFNASGADPAGGIGELRDVETHLIPRAMMALQGYVPDFAVFGDDYDTPDGTAIRDYIHVTDLAAAHVRALELLLQGHSGGALNLGTGKASRCARFSRPSPAKPASTFRTSSSRAAPAIQLIWSQTSPPRARRTELQPDPFGSCNHHPHRMGMAQKSPPAEST
jgi:nucleoside-diphosphate-sugar epimerase